MTNVIEIRSEANDSEGRATPNPLCLEGARRLDSEAVLDRLFVERGTRGFIRSDNRAESMAAAMHDSLPSVGVETL